jgi:hypothetical protein
MSVFIFIDESGDPGNILEEGASSPYYSELALQIKKETFNVLAEHIIGWQYMHGRFYEEKSLPKNPKQLKRYLDPLIHLSDTNDLCCSCVYLFKADYQGPYFHGDKRDVTKFRNFVHRKLLEYHFQCFPADGNSIELVFDRYRMSKDDRDNLETYLENNWGLPRFTNISHIDSMISGAMQVTSQLVSATKDIILKHGDDNKMRLLNFIKLKDITKI